MTAPCSSWVAAESRGWSFACHQCSGYVYGREDAVGKVSCWTQERRIRTLQTLQAHSVIMSVVIAIYPRFFHECKHTPGSWNIHGVISLVGSTGAGVRGREFDGLGGPLLALRSGVELLRVLGPPSPGAKGGSEAFPFCTKLASEFCLLSGSWRTPGRVTSSPKKPCSFLRALPFPLALEPTDDIVVALAIEGLLSSPSPGKPIAPPPGMNPGDTWPRFSLESFR